MRHKPYGAEGGLGLIFVTSFLLIAMWMVKEFAKAFPVVLQWMVDFLVWAVKLLWKLGTIVVKKIVEYREKRNE